MLGLLTSTVDGSVNRELGHTFIHRLNEQCTNVENIASLVGHHQLSSINFWSTSHHVESVQPCCPKPSERGIVYQKLTFTTTCSNTSVLRSARETISAACENSILFSSMPPKSFVKTVTLENIKLLIYKN